ncbi:MAG: hypothetical protein VKJ24_11260 [Synechococcales bacterium]|nr:hypothetical protein [Synechococcales bacterium]
MTKPPFLFKSKPEISHSIQMEILQENLRQTRLTFNIFAVAISLSLGVSISGAALLLTGNVSQGLVSAAGLLSTGFCTKVAKDANSKLDRLNRTLQGIDQTES